MKKLFNNKIFSPAHDVIISFMLQNRESLLDFIPNLQRRVEYIANEERCLGSSRRGLLALAIDINGGYYAI